jgi:hypothetical protein
VLPPPIETATEVRPAIREKQSGAGAVGGAAAGSRGRYCWRSRGRYCWYRQARYCWYRQTSALLLVRTREKLSGRYCWYAQATAWAGRKVVARSKLVPRCNLCVPVLGTCVPVYVPGVPGVPGCLWHTTSSITNPSTTSKITSCRSPRCM